MTLSQIEPTSVAECPFHNQRLTIDTEPSTSPAQENDDGSWQIDSYELGRKILRSGNVQQAGFAADFAMQPNAFMKRLPILFLEGKEHKTLRTETAKFFTATTTDKGYRDFMNQYADEIIGKFMTQKTADLSEMSMAMAVAVAARIVGLDNSIISGMHKRLESLVHFEGLEIEKQTLWEKLGLFWQQKDLFAFYLLDVRPSIRKRRKQPQDDVLSYLISLGYEDFDMLTESLVYAVAGMVTTKEFISVVFWHCMQNPEYRETMIHGEQAERYQLLHEILRLEPVVSNLYRVVTKDIEIEHNNETYHFPKGSRLDIAIHQANVDTAVVGESNLSICPGRPMTPLKPKAAEYMMSFGEGNHRCPGSFVAIQETDIFIQKLLQIEGLILTSKPVVNRNDLIKGYEVSNLKLEIV